MGNRNWRSTVPILLRLAGSAPHFLGCLGKVPSVTVEFPMSANTARALAFHLVPILVLRLAGSAPHSSVLWVLHAPKAPSVTYAFVTDTNATTL